MADSPTIRTKRIYDPPADDDGYRVLVDRLWPRGVKKSDAKIDLWAKQIAPSSELRKWFHQGPDRFDEFRRRYVQELESQTEAARQVLDESDQGTITLLYAAKDKSQNHALVLQEWLSER